MLDPQASGALRLAPNGDVIVTVAGTEIRMGFEPDEMRHLAVALAVAADEREGKVPPPEALAILYPVEGSA